MLTGCREVRARLVELARETVEATERRVLLAHVEHCPDCAAALDRQLALSSALERMTVDEFPEMPSIERRVLQEFDRAAARRPAARVSRWAMVAGLAAALFAGVVAVERRQTEPPKKQPVEAAAVPAPIAPPPAPVARSRPRVQRVSHRNSPERPVEEEQPFVAIPYTMPPDPQERTTVVRMEIPVAALIAAGFRVPVSDAGAVVEADVLMSEDGRARAIRPLGIAASR